MRLLSVTLAVLALASVSANASVVITPVGGGTAYSSAYCPVTVGFDSQPTWDGTQPVGGGAPTGSNSQFYLGRWGFFDLGSDWANIRIEQTWTKYRKWSAGNVATWEGGFWTSTNPGVWPSQVPGAITETRIQFESATALPDTGGAEPWVRDADLTASPVAPLGRYFVMHVLANGTEQNRGEEYAIIGTIVPEPATMALLGLGALGLIRRRK